MQGGNNSNRNCFSLFVAVYILPEPQNTIKSVSLRFALSQLQALRAAASGAASPAGNIYLFKSNFFHWTWV